MAKRKLPTTPKQDIPEINVLQLSWMFASTFAYEECYSFFTAPKNGTHGSVKLIANTKSRSFKAIVTRKQVMAFKPNHKAAEGMNRDISRRIKRYEGFLSYLEGLGKE